MNALHVPLGEGPPSGPPAPALLVPSGPRLLLGGADPLVGPVAPDASALFGPRGAHLFGPEGPLWVADTGHHRLLGWARLPTEDGTPADFVMGQPAFDREGRNALGEPSATTLNVPCGLGPFGEGGLVVADSWNNRVLVWFERPAESGVPADLVLGQADFSGQEPNRGKAEAGADTLHWPFQVLVHDGRLYVADAGNRRVLIWRTLPTQSGQPADLVLGQPDLQSRSDNGGQAPSSSSLRWPHDLAVLDGRLVVTDAGNNRVLLWEGLPDETNQPATTVLGQPDFSSVDHNRSNYWPDAACLNMPYAIAAGSGWLVAGDTANSRLVGWRAPLGDGIPAQALCGQPHFGAKGDNRWKEAERDSLCWPYGLQIVGQTMVVADTGNHRVLVWSLAEEGS
ncbi:MAG: hypothetical protein AAGA48_08460 [Myxococcota bacterium]